MSRCINDRPELELPLPESLKNISVLVLIALTVYISTGDVAAQDSLPDQTRYTYVFRGVGLGDALERLITDTRLSLIYESDLVAGRTTYCHAARVTAEDLLSCVLRGTGVMSARLESGTYLLMRDPEEAPRRGNLTGRVLDARTGSPLENASVILLADNTGTATNRDGRFAFGALLPGPHPVAVTHVAYHEEADTLEVTAAGDTHFEVNMTPRTVLTEPVIVTASARRPLSDNLGSTIAYAQDQPNHRTGVSPGVFNDLSTVVGVRLGNVLSDVHVQGGASNEQEYLLDGMPIFVPVANGGFVGPFSPFATGTVTVRKAGFGARYGNGLSGIVQVDHWRPPHKALSVDAQADPISLNGRLGGELRAGPDRLSATWMVAGRKGLWDVLAPPRLEDQLRQWASPDEFLLNTILESKDLPTLAPRPVPTGGLELAFNDLHATAALRFGGLRTLEVGFYRGSNAFGIGDFVQGDPNEDVFEDAYRWKNKAYRARYEWVQSSRLFLNATAWTSRYELSHPVGLPTTGGVPLSENHSPSSTDYNELAQIGVRVGADLTAGRRHSLSAAIESTRSKSEIALATSPFEGPPSLFQTLQWRVTGFVEDRIAVGRWTALTVGSRLTSLSGHERPYAEPRLSVQTDIRVRSGGVMALRMAIGLYRQYLHSFDLATYNVTSLLPRVRYWIPIDGYQTPPKAYHVSLDVRYSSVSGWESEVETFYKDQPHLLVLNNADRVHSGGGEEGKFASASAHVFGVAASVTRKTEWARASATYEFSVARLRIPGRFDGSAVPAPWDVPHRVLVSIDVAPTSRVTATLRWQAEFGRTWGFRLGYYEYLESYPDTRWVGPYDLSDPGSHRLGAFSQCDVGIGYTMRIRGVGLQGRLSFVNVLGRRNVLDWSLVENEDSEYIRVARHSMPFMPSVALRLSH